LDFSHDVPVDYLPSGEYSFEVSVRDIRNGYEKGKINLNYKLTEDTDDLYIHIPSIWKNVYDVSAYDGECLEYIVADKCGIDLITAEEQPVYSYHYECDSEGLDEVVEDLRIHGCDADFDDVRCHGNLGSSYPGGCDLSCDDNEQRCGMLYDLEALNSLMESECSSRLVCK
jgi:hypothetical protein